MKTKRHLLVWNQERRCYDLRVTEREYQDGELVGRVESTTETDSKDSQKVLDTADAAG